MEILRPESKSLAAILLFSTGAALAQPPGTFEAEVEISRSPSAVVLEYHSDVGMIEAPDQTPRLRVFGDGRYVVHYPRYMKRAGDWEGRISPAELEQLALSVAESGLLELDTPALRSRLRTAELARTTKALDAGEPVRVFHASDLESTRVRVRLDRYKRAGVLGAAGGPVDREIVWWGLRDDARRHPRVEPLQRLAALEARLRSLAEVPGLRRLAREEGS